MRKMYEINTSILKTLEVARKEAEENEGVLSEDIVVALNELNMERDEKIGAVACYAKELISFIDNIKAEEKRLKQLKDSTEKEIKGLKFYLSSVLKGEKFKNERCSLSFRKSKSTIIEDEDLLDPIYKKEKISISIDKTAIKKDIEAGKEVAGAYIQENNNIQVK